MCEVCGGLGFVEVDVPHAGTEVWAEQRPCPEKLQRALDGGEDRP